MKEVEKKDTPEISGGDVNRFVNPITGIAYPILPLPPEQPDPLFIPESPDPNPLP